MSVRPSELPTRQTERAVKRTGFRPDIEGLRAVAVIAVAQVLARWRTAPWRVGERQ